MEKKKYTYLVLLLLVSFFSLRVLAQDHHFSQFYFVPTAINPANTGVFQGDYRLITNYKNQWQSITNPFKTAYASAELSIPSDRLAFGLSFLSDVAGKAQFGTIKGDLSVAYKLRINSGNSLSAGLQFSYNQQGFKTNNLRWDNQFNGVIYDPTLPTGENFVGRSYNFIDGGAGMLWSFTNQAKKFRIRSGFSVSHVNSPRQGFTPSAERLPARVTLHSEATIQSRFDHLYFLPQILFMNQGPYQEFSFGTLIKYVFGTDNASELVYVDRWVSSAGMIGANLRAKDAIVVTAAFELKKSLLIGFSYDINISKLTPASEFRGGPEFSLSYQGKLGRY